MHLNNQLILSKTINTFLISLIFAAIGMFFGQFIPLEFMVPLLILELVMLIVVLFFRKKKKIGYGFLYFFTTLTGVTTAPVIIHYLNEIGGTMVLAALISTIVIFFVLGTIGWKTKKDLSFLSGILIAFLIALIIVSIFGLFVPDTSILHWIITIAGILIFSTFILYDLNIIKNKQWELEDVPLLALNLYLDFLNLFLYILRLFGLFPSND